MNTEQNQATPVALDALPAAVRTFVTAHLAHDYDAEMASFAEDATVTDEGHTHTGLGEIRAMLTRAAGEYTYTTEVTGAYRLDDARVDVVHHLEGDFPGGVVDLHYRFTVGAGGLIADLVIEP
ncbi:nuclear transport factor 2 family protein [Aeromicrobium alkaliterrae]|uniref:DUF4440 domain-containing protein n=1 Tax=Aeromicrobium alkaliterrae TaxID=302168 RepID=A0ABP4VT67_9ACTN